MNTEKVNSAESIDKEFVDTDQNLRIDSTIRASCGGDVLFELKPLIELPTGLQRAFWTGNFSLVHHFLEYGIKEAVLIHLRRLVSERSDRAGSQERPGSSQPFNSARFRSDKRFGIPKEQSDFAAPDLEMPIPPEYDDIGLLIPSLSETPLENGTMPPNAKNYKKAA